MDTMYCTVFFQSRTVPSMQDMADGHYVLYSVDENGVFDFCIRFLSIFLYNFIYFFISIIIKVIRFFFQSRTVPSDLQVGTSYFFECHRILSSVRSQNKGNHVFWLYENVCSNLPVCTMTLCTVQCDENGVFDFCGRLQPVRPERPVDDMTGHDW